MDEMYWINQPSSSHAEARKPHWTSRSEFPKEYYLSMTIEFGPAFSADAEMSRKDLINKLHAEAPQWERSFVGAMMLHLADCLQDYATNLAPSERIEFLNTMTPRTIHSYYEDCGSCTLST